MAKRKAPVKKNEFVTLTFEDLTHEGNGVGKINGYPLFVPYGLPGEEAVVKVSKRSAVVKKRTKIECQRYWCDKSTENNLTHT